MMRTVLSCFVGACLLVASGCGGDAGLGRVTGRVTMDGQPLPNVMVTFVPQGGGNASTGVTDSNGQYELTHVDGRGAVIGTHTVRLTTTQAQPGGAAADMGSDSEEYQKMMSGGDYRKQSLSVRETIPARYNTQSELEREVTAGQNVIDLELTSD